MKSLNYLLFAATMTSAVFAADQSSAALVTGDDFSQKYKCYVRTYELDATGAPTGIAIDTEWPPRDRKIKLSQFSLGTGHPDVDQKAFDLTKPLLHDGDAETIKKFRELDKNAQITAAVDFLRLATLRANKEAFKKRYDALLSGSAARLLPTDEDYSKFLVTSTEAEAQAPTTTEGQ